MDSSFKTLWLHLCMMSFMHLFIHLLHDVKSIRCVKISRITISLNTNIYTVVSFLITKFRSALYKRFWYIINYKVEELLVYIEVCCFYCFCILHSPATIVLLSYVSLEWVKFWYFLSSWSWSLESIYTSHILKKGPTAVRIRVYVYNV